VAVRAGAATDFTVGIDFFATGTATDFFPFSEAGAAFFAGAAAFAGFFSGWGRFLGAADGFVLAFVMVKRARLELGLGSLD
jgi:hypothetical protein